METTFRVAGAHMNLEYDCGKLHWHLVRKDTPHPLGQRKYLVWDKEWPVG